MQYRLGLDIGANSIGWCLINLDHNGRPIGVRDAGARIYTDGRDPKSRASLAEDRRVARAMRRRRDRYLRRRQVLLEVLISAGLMPDDEASRKALEIEAPFALRARALDEELAPHQVGRALFHFNQRRGFKSNRKADRKSRDEESGKIRIGIARLQAAMAGANARTYGEFLHQRLQNGLSARTRLRPEPGEGAKGDGYDFYPDRALLEEEFEAIWNSQARFHRETLTPELKERLGYVIFGQRPLKAPKVGRCTFLDEPRLPKAHPLFQERRLYEEVNALRVAHTGASERSLTLAERDKLVLKLKGARTVAFPTLRKLLKLSPKARFNKETEARDKLLGDEVFAQLSNKKLFGARWAHFDSETQWRVIERIREEEDPDKLLLWLRESFDLGEETAGAVADARLPEGHGRIGLTATRAILRELKTAVITYDEAVKRASELPHHSDFRTGEIWDTLPYYGEILERQIPPGSGDPADPDDLRLGRITNPTVHIGLGQLRRLVNALIRRHGRPDQIVVELARELKQNERQRSDSIRRIKADTAAAERRSEKLRELNQADKGANRLLLRLWEESNPRNPLDRRCPYCGEQICISELFSQAIDIDHILPYSLTLDDSPANKIVSHATCNREKRNRTPHGAFGDSPRWPAISELAARLPSNKRWRFAPDAEERFDADGGFLGRHLKDTQYLSRLARQYLSALYPNEGEGSSKVWVIPGRLTEMLRRTWGLNSLLPDHNYAGNVHAKKNRLDHRHHTIDAAVIAVTDRSLLSRLSREAGLREQQELERVIAEVEPPWESFQDELKTRLESIVVSHRADHGRISPSRRALGQDQTAGRLHNDTAYGLTGKLDAKGNSIVVRRVPLTTLKSEKDLAKVRDPDLRRALEQATRGLSGKSFEQALSAFSGSPGHYKGIRHLRITEPLKVIGVQDRQGRIYKGYKGDANYRYDVWRLPDGKWQAEVVSMFDAHKPNWQSDVKQAYPTAKKVLRLHQNDVLVLEFSEGATEYMRVVKFALSGQVTLAGHQESGALKDRDKSLEDPFKYISPTASGLKKARARQARIDELGHIWDPGPLDH